MQRKREVETEREREIQRDIVRTIILKLQAMCSNREKRQEDKSRAMRR